MIINTADCHRLPPAYCITYIYAYTGIGEYHLKPKYAHLSQGVLDLELVQAPTVPELLQELRQNSDCQSTHGKLCTYTSGSVNNFHPMYVTFVVKQALAPL